MSPATTTANTANNGSTMGVKLIGVLPNFHRPEKMAINAKDLYGPHRRVGESKPTQCLFLTDDGSLKWVAVNTGVFPGRWSFKDVSHLVFPPFPAGSWNVGQIRRLKNGEVSFTRTLSMPIEGIDVWHPTRIDFTEFELIGQFMGETQARLWHVKHPLFKEKPIFVKLAPWGYRWSKVVMENETRVYQRVDGLGIAPVFLGHVTYRGAVIGFMLEWVEGAKTTERDDKCARIEVVKKLHALGITHGSAHRRNFLKIGGNVIMVDFEASKFDEEATDKRKAEDIRRISHFSGDMLEPADEQDDDPLLEANRFFDEMADESDVNWTDDSEAE
ncbi:hypothetical protein F4803DRAFT_567561 [Xylaria telfairii]|nr:hypothetical protein F4803DRAFT_567561 [Xylaria telfairii]